MLTRGYKIPTVDEREHTSMMFMMFTFFDVTVQRQMGGAEGGNAVPTDGEVKEMLQTNRGLPKLRILGYNPRTQQKIVLVLGGAELVQMVAGASVTAALNKEDNDASKDLLAPEQRHALCSSILPRLRLRLRLPLL